MTYRMRRGLMILLSLSALSGVAVWQFRNAMETALEQPIGISAPTLYEIARGQSLTKVARAFVENGWLSHAIFLRLEASRQRVAGKLQAGVYEVTPQDTPRTLLRKFVTGSVKRYQFTIVEGSTFANLRRQIEQLPGVKATIESLSDQAIMERIGAPDEVPEGLFFPSTYFYEHNTLDWELLKRAYVTMRDTLEREWSRRQPDLPFSSVYEALILASIIEKETGQASERSEIAGVFVRRLQQGMKLQTDPTVIYGLGEAFDGNLRRADLERDTPYNTYTRAGLPPSPIAMPGQAAIAAALNPAPGAALYFVARGDGSHVFSATLEAHQAAVNEFQLKSPGGS